MASYPNSDCLAKTYASIDDLRRDYQRDGFVSIKALIPRSRLEKIEAELADTFSEYANDAKFPIDSAIINLDRENKALLHELHLATTKLISLRSMFSLFTSVVSDLTSRQEPVYEISGGYLLGHSD